MWLVELAPIVDPDLVVTTIAGTLGISLQPGSTMIESIVDWCLGRRMLLIIDNCEHVLDPVTELVRAIVVDCATVTIIATSREPLGVAGEIVARIASLEEREAVELFVLAPPGRPMPVSSRATPTATRSAGSVGASMGSRWRSSLLQPGSVRWARRSC